MNQPTDNVLRLLLCTAPDLAVARRLAAGLLDHHLAACVSLLPGVESHYEWEGHRECASEVQMFIKTVPSRWEAARDFLQQQHPYACPEILQLPAEASANYAAWVAAQTNL